MLSPTVCSEKISPAAKTDLNKSTADQCLPEKDIDIHLPL